MSSLTNINNNASVTNVGRTTPVSPGVQPASGSIPVVLASDQATIPVAEQNKIQSEVALSLLGIPRAEVALGIFADVNTYDVNPAEWAKSPEDHTSVSTTAGSVGYGIKHLPNEAGALVEAPVDEIAVLTSKRFFRYQPGRVSAATFGVKCTISPSNYNTPFNLNPARRKYGIFDKFDGYYWETSDDGRNDHFSVVRRTQSLLRYIPLKFGNGQVEDHAIVGKAPNSDVIPANARPATVKLLTTNRFIYAQAAFDAAAGSGNVYLAGLSAGDKLKCLRDMDLAMESYISDMQYGGNSHSIVNATTYAVAVLNNPTAERLVHQYFRDTIIAALNNAGEGSAVAKITELAGYTMDAVSGTQPSASIIANATYGLRSKISTIFSIYSRFLAYIASTYRYAETLAYTSTSKADDATGEGALSTDQIKNKCYRDVTYVVSGYARDLNGGGNAGTVFNAKSFYFGNLNNSNSIQVYSQKDSIGAIAEIGRHTYIKDLISSSANVQVGSKSIASVFTKFGLAANTATFNALADIIINNFTTEYSGQMVQGTEAQFGNLVILRDNLVMTHAAVFDPLLLKPKKQIAIRVTAGSIGTIETAEDEFVRGQYINFYGTAARTANGTGLLPNKLYKVLSVAGAKSNILTLSDPLSSTPSVPVSITAPTDGSILYIEPNVPFIFPDHYLASYSPTDSSSIVSRPDGAFPYMYCATDKSLSALDDGDVTVGYINTALSMPAGAAKLRVQIDNVNLIYNNWVKQNVDPKYYSVYEYRIPRSRFSTDQLNGEKDNITVYSDIATAAASANGSAGGKAFAGQNVLNPTTNGRQTNTSLWDLDFTKVTMLKIEFSWYGAVGALFLAYVPVGNGEARWVRVHHIRASNQLKISSLGNATLPITYEVYGGGSPNRLGGAADQSEKGYGSISNHIVKYGASYYIDGGDRGTVRLYSHSSPTITDVYGSKYPVSSGVVIDSIGSYIDVSGMANRPTDLVFFMGAKVITGSSADQNIEVTWVSGTRLYLNVATLQGSVQYIISNRASIVFGLKAKDVILNQLGVGVRNRVQVYPTKLSTANIASDGQPAATTVKMKIVKTPFFQSSTVTTGNFTLSSNYILSTNKIALATTTPGFMTTDGDFLYGWFRAQIGSDIGTVFGRLYRETGSYYFTILQTFSVTVTLLLTSNFLPDGRYTANGTVIVTPVEGIQEKERLSSVVVSTQTQTPIPKTGTEVTAFFLKPGSDHFDLLTYFDYNKDYLSYPLTNQIESLYLAVSGAQAYTVNPITSIEAGLTWEEQ